MATAGALAELEGIIREWDARLAEMRRRSLEMSETDAVRYQSHLRTLAAKVETLRSRWDDRGLSPILAPEVVARVLAAKEDLETTFAAVGPSLTALLPR